MGTKAWRGLALFLCLWTTNLAVAAEWTLVPSVTQKSEFNSNINLTYNSPISDYIFTLTPAVDFNYTTTITLVLLWGCTPSTSPLAAAQAAAAAIAAPDQTNYLLGRKTPWKFPSGKNPN